MPRSGNLRGSAQTCRLLRGGRRPEAVAASLSAGTQTRADNRQIIDIQQRYIAFLAGTA